MLREVYSDGNYLLSSLRKPEGPDPYLSALVMAREDAVAEFEKKYDRVPYWERCIMEIQNSKFRVSVRIKELAREETFTNSHPDLASRSQKKNPKGKKNDAG